LVETSPRG